MGAMTEIRPISPVDMANQIGEAVAKGNRPPGGQIKFTGPPTENRTSTNLPVNAETNSNVAAYRANTPKSSVELVNLGQVAILGGNIDIGT